MVDSGTFFPELVDEIEKEKKEDEDKDRAWGLVKSRKSTNIDNRQILKWSIRDSKINYLNYIFCLEEELNLAD